MPSYLALLGHNPSLSIAELAAAVPDFTQTHRFGMTMITFETSLDLSQQWFESLGGTVLLAKRLTGDAVDLSDIPSLLTAETEKIKGKVTFALRFEGIPRSAARELYRTCKDRLKSQSVPSRYIGNEKSPALPLQLHEHGFLDGNACELVIARNGKTVWIGRTIAAQHTKRYALRDMKKPVRDMTAGILPPKLAQIMLNFGAFLTRERNPEKKSDTLSLLDPFCGSGVIPMEGLLRGWNVLACDVSQKAVQGCVKNLEWTRKTFGIAKKDVTSDIWKQDARKPFALKNAPDVIVSETTLGPSLTRRPTVKDVEKWRRETDALQEAFLKNVSETLPGTPLVLTWPVWFPKSRAVTLDKAMAACDKLGYRRVLPPGIDPALPPRLSLLYRRKEQFVGREIVLLVPSA